MGDKTLGGRTPAKAAIVFDWDNWWATSLSAGPSDAMDYFGEVYQYYRTLLKMHIPVDMIGVEDSLSDYKILVAPMLYMCKDGFDEKIRSFVKDGGTFVTTYFSGYVEDHDLVITGGYPGRLRDILGIWVEESDAIPPEKTWHTFHYEHETYPAEILCDLLHLEGAESLGEYDNDFYAGMPAVTVHGFGKGKAYYVAARSSETFYNKFFDRILKEQGVEPVVTGEFETCIEATVRENEKGSFLFLLNHGESVGSVTLKQGGTDLLSGREYGPGAEVSLEAKGVALIQLKH